MKNLYFGMLFFVASFAHADIYQCDDHGVTSFQSKPCSNGQKFQKKIKVEKAPNEWIRPELSKIVSYTPPKTTAPTVAKTEPPFYQKWFQALKQKIGF